MSTDQRLRLACDDCGKVLLVKPDLAGAKVKCPACGAVTQVPLPDEPPRRSDYRGPARPAARWPWVAAVVGVFVVAVVVGVVVGTSDDHNPQPAPVADAGNPDPPKGKANPQPNDSPAKGNTPGTKADPGQEKGDTKGRKGAPPIVPPKKDPDPSPAESKVVWATPEDLRKAEEKVLGDAKKAVADLKGRASSRLSPSGFRPLPAAVIPELIECLQSPDRDVRQEAAETLAYHARDPKKAADAIRKAHSAEKDPRVRDQFALALKMLEAAEELPVLADRDRIDELLDPAVCKLTANLLRRFDNTTVTGFFDGKRVRWEMIQPLKEQLPEVATLTPEGAECRAVVGWRWLVNAGDGKKSLARPPIGALLRLEDPLLLKESLLPAGTILMQTTWGWTVVTREQAEKYARAFADSKGYLCQQNCGELGELGLALLKRPPEPKAPPMPDGTPAPDPKPGTNPFRGDPPPKPDGKEEPRKDPTISARSPSTDRR